MNHIPDTYPFAPPGDVVENFHGTLVADPYRWLEEHHTPETHAWTQAQNHLTDTWLRQDPLWPTLHQRYTQLWNYTRYSVPEKQGPYYVFWKNDGLQNQPVMYRQTDLQAPPEVLLDPNSLSPDGTVAVMATEFNADGSLMAYSLSRSGSDWQDIRVLRVATGEVLPDILSWTKFSGIAWIGEGFYYTRFPAPDGDPESTINKDYRLYWHQLGTAQAEDPIIFETPAQDLTFQPILTDDQQYLVVLTYSGTDRRNGVLYRQQASQDEFVTLLPHGQAAFELIGNSGTQFYFKTDHQASRGRVVVIDLHHPQPEHWQEVIPENEDNVEQVKLLGGQLLVLYVHHAHHRLKRFDMKGHAIQEIALPALGALSELSGKPQQSECFFGFASFLFPYRTYRLDLNTGESQRLHQPALDFDPDGYETHQVFVTSKDGTQVPMFLTHRKNITLSGEHPVLMYGYGGFRHAMTPAFSVLNLPFLDAGGIYAQVNLRGGNEYGTAWYEAGTLERKQNVFDDFIAAGEWLIQQGYTQPAKLAIRGGSNGGLLVGACMTQRPDLFGAVVCQVPVLDMLRYHRFTIGRYWVSDYGNAETQPAHFKFMYAYSPLHNIRANVVYPPVLVTTGDHDDRVVPAHAKKFVATLQALHQGNALILLRVDMDAGHGRGKPMLKQIEEATDIMTFLFKTLLMAT